MNNQTDDIAQENKSQEYNFNCFQGAEDLLKNIDNKDKKEKIKAILFDLFNIKNVNFLFGAGTSSGVIPTMKDLKNRVMEKLDNKEKELFDKNDKQNLEKTLEILYSGKTYFENNPQGKDNSEFNTLKNLIQKIEETIFQAINIKIGINCEDEAQKEVFKSYMKFYNKVTYRNKDLNRVNIFTTNNDLFNEYVLDHLNIDYNNGFGGGLKRSFNPARFEYIYTKKMDEGIEKYEPLNHMIYLYKLHGSINWIEAENNNSLFDIEEIYLKPEEHKPKETCLIYPTPLKEGKSLTSPYTDIIREFQKKLSLPNSVLFIIGYSFSDSHINAIIYRALASNNSLSVVVFADKGKLTRIPLFSINDKRVYVIYGKDKDKTIHYFNYFVDELIPEHKQDEEDENYKKIVNAFKEAKEG